jgi:methylation protein EvaC
MTRCRICATRLEPFISLGRMPIANGFLGAEAFSREFFFDLGAALCGRCAMPQLTQSVPREKVFNERYPFFTSSSARMAAHFERFAWNVMRDRLAASDSFVVEIGSNDGTLLGHFARHGVRHLGVEPSSSVAMAAEGRGVRSLRRFFDEDVAREIARDDGLADVILAANCLSHVDDLHALANGIGLLMKPRGVLIFEDPYLGDILANTAYDQIYDEHIFYFSLEGVARWLGRYELEVVDVERQQVHGGSMRYTVARRGAFPMDPSVSALLGEESRAGLNRPETFERFRGRVEESREALVRLLRGLKRQGRRVAGYGATSKSTTVLNYCGIKPDLVEFISDTTPLKQEKFSPGMHIPVRPHSQFVSRYPDHALLFAWNHAAEIMQKELAFRGAGGKWIGYVPEVRVMD